MQFGENSRYWTVIIIMSDSQDLLRTQLKNSLKMTQKLNKKNEETIDTFAWVQGHNEIVDSLARKGAQTPSVGYEPFCIISFTNILIFPNIVLIHNIRRN